MTPVAAAQQIRTSFPAAEPLPEFIWSSPLSRCREVALLLSQCLDGIDVSIEPRLLEMSFGRWEGRLWSEIEAQDGLLFGLWCADWEKEAPPEGERVFQLQHRVDSWLQELDPQRHHLLIAHAGVIRALHVLIHRLSWKEAMALEVPHLVLSRFCVTSQ
jgi:alpha-ribazole phosphatase